MALTGIQKLTTHKSKQIEVSTYGIVGGFMLFLEDSEVRALPPAVCVNFVDPFEPIEEEPEYQAKYNWDRDVVPLLAQLPPRIADILRLRHDGMIEEGIAAFFEVSQAAINYTIQRAYLRLDFLYRRPKIEDCELRRLLSICLEPNDVELMVKLWWNPCQSMAVCAEFRSQGKIRHHFLIALTTMFEILGDHPELTPIYNHFKRVHDEKLYNMLVNQEHDPSQKEKRAKTLALGKEERLKRREESRTRSKKVERNKLIKQKRASLYDQFVENLIEKRYSLQQELDEIQGTQTT